ncbi:hypothetical protein BG74_06515 [Sodalis-like endosymbiont of Proechinophthirus fluctus]|nr:hypothetical protein BG74_06515 [Sodalis-like endosymbiont of Proechinophthirus fluctus]
MIFRNLEWDREMVFHLKLIRNLLSLNQIPREVFFLGGGGERERENAHRCEYEYVFEGHQKF